MRLTFHNSLPCLEAFNITLFYILLLQWPSFSVETESFVCFDISFTCIHTQTI